MCFFFFLTSAIFTCHQLKASIRKKMRKGVPAVVQWINDLACLCGHWFNHWPGAVGKGFGGAAIMAKAAAAAWT